MLPIQKQFLTNRRTRPALRNRSWYTIRKLKGIVAHWTANSSRGADAQANRNYFNNTTVYASAHYLIDDHSIIQALPDHEVGYHVGGRSYKPIGESIRENNLTPNYFLIGFEMCVNQDGDWNKTYWNSVELAQHLLSKYNFTVNELYRHYDITGKLCPMMMIEEQSWQRFKQDVNNGLDFKIENPIKLGFINTRELNVRSGNGVQFPVVDELHQGDKIEVFEEVGNWIRIGRDKWVHKHYVEITFSKMDGVIESPSGLNVRSGPGMQHPVIENLPDSSNIEIYNKVGNWYEIGRDKFVFHRLVKIVEIKTGRISFTNFLNVRSGPGTNHNRVGRLQRDTLVKILDTEGHWYKVGEDQWVYKAYVRLVD